MINEDKAVSVVSSVSCYSVTKSQVSTPPITTMRSEETCTVQCAWPWRTSNGPGWEGEPSTEIHSVLFEADPPIKRILSSLSAELWSILGDLVSTSLDQDVIPSKE